MDVLVRPRRFLYTQRFSFIPVPVLQYSMGLCLCSCCCVCVCGDMHMYACVRACVPNPPLLPKTNTYRPTCRRISSHLISSHLISSHLRSVLTLFLHCNFRLSLRLIGNKFNTKLTFVKPPSCEGRGTRFGSTHVFKGRNDLTTWLVRHYTNGL